MRKLKVFSWTKIDEDVTQDTLNQVVEDLIEDVLTENDLFSERCATFQTSGKWKEIGDTPSAEFFDFEGIFTIIDPVTGELAGRGKYIADLSCPRTKEDVCTLTKMSLRVKSEDVPTIRSLCG